MNFISIVQAKIPTAIDIGETFFLVAHQYGIEYVYWSKGELKFVYCGRSVSEVLSMKNITHWCIPENPNKSYNE